jgi:hypothetical protein
VSATYPHFRAPACTTRHRSACARRRPGSDDEDDGDDQEEQEQEQEDHDDDEVLLDADSDEDQLQVNESANKKFPLAPRLLDDMGFKNNSLLESVLSSPNEVSGLVQKEQGMGLIMGYQMAKVLKAEATSMRLMVVSGTTKDGDWKEAHTSTLPTKFKLQRSIVAQELESRFQVDGTPDKHTLLALKLDPSVNTTVEDGIFSSRTASQQLMEGEYLRRLVRRYKIMFMAANAVVSSVSDSQVNSSAPLPAKRGAPSMGGVAKKGPASVLSRLNPDSPHDKAVLIDPNTDQSLAVIKLEEAKYDSICVFVLANKEQFMDAGVFDLGLSWARQKSVLPEHYSLWLAEVGCAKVASANVEVVFSGAGRINMKSHCLDPQLLSDYAFLHYNYKYDWIRPKLEEILLEFRTRTRPQDRPGLSDVHWGTQ